MYLAEREGFESSYDIQKISKRTSSESSPVSLNLFYKSAISSNRSLPRLAVVDNIRMLGCITGYLDFCQANFEASD